MSYKMQQSSHDNSSILEADDDKTIVKVVSDSNSDSDGDSISESDDDSDSCSLADSYDEAVARIHDIEKSNKKTSSTDKIAMQSKAIDLGPVKHQTSEIVPFEKHSS